MAGKYKTFDPIFKENTVLLSYEKSSIKELADELGIFKHYITKWRKEYEEFGSGSFCGSGYPRVHPDNKKFFELKKTSKESELRFEILKNASPYLHQGKLKVYQFIKSNEKKYTIAKMCRVLGVGNGRYIRWKYNGVSKKQQELALLKEEIKSIFYRFKKHYGRNKITKELNRLGYEICMTQVSLYMRQLGLRYVKKRKFKVTTNSKHTYCIAPNVLNREFKVDGYSKVWVSDITYLETTDGFLYLTIIMDLYDRKIIGWSLGSWLTTNKTTIPALEMAVSNRKVSNELIFHSDRGVQYANKVFTKKLNSYKLIRSMSGKGDSLDNAVSESFFGSLKRELIYLKSNLISKKQMQVEIFEFIENWYNKKRMHSALNYKTIEQFNAINNLESFVGFDVNE